MFGYFMRKKGSKVPKVDGVSYRSTFEATISSSITDASILYEAIRLPYTISKQAHYTPDWVMPKQCIVVEAKGYFSSSDRTKMLMVKHQYPNLDVRFIFQRDNKLSKTSKNTYSSWATKHGFQFVVGTAIPKEWLKHRPTKEQRKAFTDSITPLLKSKEAKKTKEGK